MKLEEIIIVKEFVFYYWFTPGSVLLHSHINTILAIWEQLGKRKNPIILYRCESAQLCFLNWEVV